MRRPTEAIPLARTWGRLTHSWLHGSDGGGAARAATPLPVALALAGPGRARERRMFFTTPVFFAVHPAPPSLATRSNRVRSASLLKRTSSSRG
jgi:hypothetical protein